MPRGLGRFELNRFNGRSCCMPVGTQAQPTDTREPPGYRRASAARSAADYFRLAARLRVRVLCALGQRARPTAHGES